MFHLTDILRQAFPLHDPPLLTEQKDRMHQQIILVGHCNIDGPRLQREISTKLPETDVIRVNSDDDLQRACNSPCALLLINREPVGFERDGLDLVRDLRESHPSLRMMLVSDYDDAQQEAQQLGALPGFGKREIGSDSLIERIEEAMKANAE
jgi:DNA-binding NarL/FixJ family response regulator